MTKTLYLLRHAESPGRFDLSDFERPLSQLGISQAKKVGAYLSNLDTIDMTLCSSATRTQETLKGLMSAGAHIKKDQILDALYNAPTGDLLDTIQKQSDEISHLMVVAHNPGIHQLAHMLLDRKFIDQLGLSYAPATLSVINCECDKWENIQPGQNQLSHLIHQD